VKKTDDQWRKHVGYVRKCEIHTEACWKRPLRRLRRRWKDNIKMDLNEIGFEDGRWMKLAQDHVQWQALVLIALNLQVLLPEN
jgi:hypothetical protein